MINKPHLPKNRPTSRCYAKSFTVQDMFWPMMTELGYKELLWQSMQSQIRNQILATELFFLLHSLSTWAQLILCSTYAAFRLLIANTIKMFQVTLTTAVNELLQILRLVLQMLTILSALCSVSFVVVSWILNILCWCILKTPLHYYIDQNNLK